MLLHIIPGEQEDFRSEQGLQTLRYCPTEFFRSKQACFWWSSSIKVQTGKCQLKRKVSLGQSSQGVSSLEGKSLWNCSQNIWICLCQNTGLGGPVGWASDSWFQLRFWSQGCVFKLCVWLYAGHQAYFLKKIKTNTHQRSGGYLGERVETKIGQGQGPLFQFTCLIFQNKQQTTTCYLSEVFQESPGHYYYSQPCWASSYHSFITHVKQMLWWIVNSFNAETRQLECLGKDERKYHNPHWVAVKSN